MGHHQTSQMGNSGCRLRGTGPHPQASTLEISSPQGTGKEAGAEAERLVPPVLIHSLRSLDAGEVYSPCPVTTHRVCVFLGYFPFQKPNAAASLAHGLQPLLSPEPQGKCASFVSLGINLSQVSKADSYQQHEAGAMCRKLGTTAPQQWRNYWMGSQTLITELFPSSPGRSSCYRFRLAFYTALLCSGQGGCESLFHNLLGSCRWAEKGLWNVSGLHKKDGN